MAVSLRYLRRVPTASLNIPSRPPVPLSLSPVCRLAGPGLSTKYSTDSSTSSQSSSRPSRLRRLVGFVSIAAFAFTVAHLYQTKGTIERLMSVQVLTDEDSLSAFNPSDDRIREIDSYLREHPIAITLRNNPAFAESRPHLKIPEALRVRNLTAGTLAGPNRIAVPPYTFSEAGGKSLISLMYIGSDVSGHPGIIHGGLLATLLDEGLARCCFPALPNKVGVTANLNIDYRRPAMADSYIVLRAETIKVEGRKAWVEGRIETLPKNGEEPITLVEAKGLFVEPKQAATMASLYRVAG